ncbi:MAG: T9SS type A sorting domain-containing protein, partial [Ignavibacteria bacterium]|nr:T9SS type A sorting domain-containing protein [Ignavibacteria bacterium]
RQMCIRDSWYTGPLTTVFNQTNVNLIATSGNFVSITLDNPFFYDPTKSLVVEIEQCGYSGTGFNVFTTTTSGQKRNTSTTASVPCPHPWLNTGAFMTHTGIDITPITNPFSLCRNSINKPILDFTAIRDTISVTIGSNKVVTDLVVRIDTVLHSWDSDLSFYITKGSASTKFINRVGGSGDNFIGTNIKDSAALCQIGSTGCNTAPFTGTYRPSVGGSFAGFINQPVNGNWILTITDTVGGDTGQLRAWCLVIRWQDITSGQSGTTELPSYYELKQNYPNPFNPSTTIKFSIPKGENVKLTVFDMLGQEVKVLVNEFRSAGVYEINFDASLFSSGVYFYKIETEGFTDTKKMLLVK